MKNQNLLSLLTLAMITFFSSCQTIESINVEMTTEEAVETIEQSLAKSAGGYAKYMEALAIAYAATMDSCGISGDTIITTAVTTGTTTYNYSSTVDYSLTCVSGTPSSMSATLASNGTLAGPRIGTTGNAAGTSTVGNLGAAQTEYDVDGTYTRDGTVTSKIAQKGSYTYNLGCTMTNVMVNKTTKVISGGSANFTFAGVSQGLGSKSFNYMGTITFNGAGGATITLAGTNHTIAID